MRIPAACVVHELGYVVLDDETRKAYRVVTHPVFEFITSEAYKKKENEYWPATRPVSVTHELFKDDATYKTVEVDYVDHMVYWPEMSARDIKMCLLFLCDVSKYLAQNNLCLGSHMWNITLTGGRPLLIDLGDFFHGVNKQYVYRTIVSHLVPPFTDNHTPLRPEKWMTNYDEILVQIKNIEGLVRTPSASGVQIAEELKRCLSNIIPREASHIWDSYPAQKKMPTDIETLESYAQNMRPNLCARIKQKAPQTLLDLGCARGLYSLFAAIQGASVVGLDYSHEMIGDANQKSAALKLKCHFAFIDLLDIKKWGLGGGYGDCLSRFKSDAVIAPALIHHVHGKNKPLEILITEWANAATQWIMVEYIPLDVNNQPIDLNTITDTLHDLGFKNIDILNSHPAPRKWIFAEKT